MTQRGFPFDAGEGLAYELDWSLMARLWARSGVVRGQLNELAVFADSSGMQVKIPSGHAWVRGHYYTNDAEVTQTITTPHATLARIDRIVLRIDYSANTIRLALLTGTAAASPAVPALTQTDSLYEYSLAQVNVAAGAGNIAAGNVVIDSTYVSNLQNPEASLTLSGTNPIITAQRTGSVTSNHQLVAGAQGISNQYGLYNAVALRYEWYTTSAGVLTAPNGLAAAGAGLSVISGGASITGTTSIIGATSITGTLAVSGAINGQTIGSSTSFTGSVGVGNGLTVTAGGIVVVSGGANITGTVVTSTSVTVGNSLVVSTGGINITGTATFNNNVVVTGTINGQTISATASFTGSLATASGITAGNGLTVTTGGIVVSAGGANITGAVVTSTTASIGGALTVSAGGAAITGNSTVTGTLTVTSTINGQTISSSPSFSGTITAGTGLVATTGGLTVSAGGASIAGTVTLTGTGNVLTTANAGTAGVYTTRVNTGGTMYIGIDSSAGTTLFNMGAYAAGINVPVNFVIRTGNSIQAVNISSTGVANFVVALSVGSGTVASAGAVRLANGGAINTAWFNGVTTLDLNVASYSGAALTVGDSQTGTTLTLAAASGVIVSSTILRPSTNGTADLGASSFRWGTVYAATGTINTSHSSAKQDMRRVPPGFLLNLARETIPYTYRYKLGGEADKYTRVGFKAEDTSELLSIDRASHDPASTAVAALGAVVDLEQELRAEIAELRNRLAAVGG